MSIDHFFDPDLYHSGIGPGNRVAGFYLDRATEWQSPILEVGCGTGDVLIPLARAGFQITGVDMSEGMLSKLSTILLSESEEVQARVSIRKQDAMCLDDRSEFGQIFATNEFCNLVTDSDDLLDFFQRCKRALKPDGRVVLDVPTFDVEYLGRFSHKECHIYRDQGVFSFHDEKLIQVWERTRYDYHTRILEALFRYEIISRSGDIEKAWIRRLRLYPRTELELVLLLKTAGFSKIRAQSELDRLVLYAQI